VAHLPRGCPWQHVGHAVQRAESKAVDGVFALLGLPRVDGPLTEQITLPHRHGRLGLSHTSPTDGVTAYLAAAATAHRVSYYTDIHLNYSLIYIIYKTSVFFVCGLGYGA
jgi:hypothetical protein